MKMLIGGKHADAEGGKALEVWNPYTGAVIDTVPDAAKNDVDHAVSCAVEAQKKWRKVAAYERAENIFRFVELVDDNFEKIARSLTAEIGKPIKESRGEIGCMRDTFRSFAEKVKHVYGDIIPAGCEPGTDKTVLLTVREPLGVIACITPFNFPCWSFSVKVAPAIIAGNAVIVKPSSDGPLTIGLLGDLLVEAGVPEGIIQIVTGRGSTVGNWLCEHKNVHGITLTGSTQVGIQTAKSGAGHLAHVTLELGGNDAFIVLEDADIDLAVNQTVSGRLSNNGQICCAAKRFLIHNDVKEEFTQKVVEAVKALKRGDPMDPVTQVSCLISEKAAREVEQQVEHTLRQGAKLLAGGQREGAHYAPTVLTDVTPKMDVARDMEIFGPVVPIIGIGDLDEALEIANASCYGLGGSIFTRDMQRAFYAVNELQCGGTIINGSSYFSTVEMAFGGYKHSGIGREGVIASYDEVTQIKTIVLKNLW